MEFVDRRTLSRHNPIPPSRDTVTYPLRCGGNWRLAPFLSPNSVALTSPSRAPHRLPRLLKINKPPSNNSCDAPKLFLHVLRYFFLFFSSELLVFFLLVALLTPFNLSPNTLPEQMKMHKLGQCLLVRKVPTQGKKCGRSILQVEAFFTTWHVRSRCITALAAAFQMLHTLHEPSGNDKELVVKAIEEHPDGKVEDMWACFFNLWSIMWWTGSDWELWSMA